jgi:hypothetical protein
MAQIQGSRGRTPVDSAIANATFTTPCRAFRVATRLIPLAQHTPAARLGDRDKQVSWLAAEVLASPSRIFIQWPLMRAHRVQLRGQPGFYPSSRFNPLAGNLSRAGKVPERTRGVNRRGSVRRTREVSVFRPRIVPVIRDERHVLRGRA